MPDADPDDVLDIKPIIDTVTMIQTEIASHSASSQLSQIVAVPAQTNETGQSVRDPHNQPHTVKLKLAAFTKSESGSISMAIANLLASTATPYLFAEDKAFVKFMAIVCPKYTVPDGDTFSKREIPKIYTMVREKVKLLVRDIPFMGLSTDVVIGCSGRQYINISASFVDDEWTMKIATLGSRVMNKGDTPVQVAALMQSVLEEYSIEPTRVSAVTTEPGSTLELAVVGELKMPHVPCFAHLLNTFVEKVVKHKFVTQLTEKIRALYNLLSKSRNAGYDFLSIQKSIGLPTNEMPSICAARWWPEIVQYEFVVSQEKAVFAFCNDQTYEEISQIALTNENLQQVHIVNSLMMDMERIRKSLGVETDVTGSLIHPIMLKGQEIITKNGSQFLGVPGVIEFKQYVNMLYDTLQKAYQAGVSHHLEMAAFLDPRFERSSAGTLAPIIRHDLVMEPPAVVAQKAPPNALQRIFNDEDELMPESPRTIEHDIEDFLLERKISLAECPLQWWRGKRSKMDFLPKMARKYMCIPATCVPSERAFTIGGNDVNKDRCALTDEHVQQLMFLARNKELIEW